MFKTLVFSVAWLGALASFGATEYFADAVNGNDDWDGTAETYQGGMVGPKLSLQAAADAAGEGSTKADMNILTLLPGDYTNGVNTANHCRLYLTAPLLIRSKNGRASREKTCIVGEWDVSDPTNTTYPYGMGPNAVRCVTVASAGDGARFEGLTFYHGAAPYGNGSGASSSGGAILVDGSKYATVVDCAVRECQATRGGGIYNDSPEGRVVVARCLFKGNRCSKYGQATRGANCYWCVFDDNGPTRDAAGAVQGQDSVGTSAVCAYSKLVVNCTFVNNSNVGVGAVNTDFASGVWNCIGVNNGSGAVRSGLTAGYHNLVSDKSGMTANDSVYVAFTTSAEVYSPYTEDYRLIRTAKSIGAGNADWLAKIPEEFQNVDYAGNAVAATDGKVNCGAVQTADESEVFSGIALNADLANGRWDIDGVPITSQYRTFWHQPTLPSTYKFHFVPVPNRQVVYFALGETFYPPHQDNSIAVIQKNQRVQTLSPALTTNIAWADADNGDDETGDGSEGNPYKTLQKALNSRADAYSVCVCARPGNYNEGGATFLDLATRLYVSDKRGGTVRVWAVDGPDKTFITGAVDPETGACGTNAVRCVGIANTNKTVVQGFTLRNGYTANDGTGGAGSLTYGAGLCNTTTGGSGRSTGYLVDCVVKDCKGGRGTAAYGGVLLRCRVSNCSVDNQGVFRQSKLYSSLVTGSTGSSCVVSDKSQAYNCTFYGNKQEVVNGPNTSYSKYGYAYNCVLAGRTSGNDIVTKDYEDDMILHTLYGQSSGGPASALATDVGENPVRFASVKTGDYRLLSHSAGATLGSLDYVTYPTDIDGNLLAIDAEGRVPVGAFGVVATETFYVSPTGSDDNDGKSETAPFKTLAKALGEATDVFGTVVALPGTYAEGSMIQTKDESTTAAVTPTLPARAVVRSGVLLVSRDGAAATVIEGAADNGGCGPNVMRGVFVCAGGRLKGFTVRNGNTLGGDISTAATVDHLGGGIASYEGATRAERGLGIVEDCIVENCQALRGGGVNCGTYRNCVFRGNKLPFNKPAQAARYAVLEGCLFDGNGLNIDCHSTVYCCTAVNCTLLANNSRGSGIVRNDGGDASRPIANCVIAGGSICVANCYNCVFSTWTQNIAEGTVNEVNCVRADVKVDASGRPEAGSPVIDAGDNAQVSSELLAAGDLAGGSRVSNAKVDAGCYEYDRRGDYAKALGGRIVVGEVPAEATLDGKVLRLPVGKVAVDWPARGTQYEYNVKVTGTGSLVVTVNGVATTYTAADGAQKLAFDSELAQNALSFVYTPGEDDTGWAELSGFRRNVGLVTVVQ